MKLLHNLISLKACVNINLSHHVEQVVSVVWDSQGTQYQYGKGLTVLLDGSVAAKAETLQGGKGLTVNL